MATYFQGTLTHDYSTTIYVVDESQYCGSKSVYLGRAYAITFKGSKDTYYFPVDNSRLYVYRPKNSACVLVRDEVEYMRVYNVLTDLGISLNEIAPYI